MHSLCVAVLACMLLVCEADVPAVRGLLKRLIPAQEAQFVRGVCVLNGVLLLPGCEEWLP